MQYIEIYDDFIEGKLNTESERKLMARLTLDDELRTNFRHYLVVTSSIVDFVDNQRLPSDVRDSVLQIVGISNKVNTEDSKTGFTGKKVMSKYLNWRFIGGLITGIILSLFTSYFMLHNNPETVQKSQTRKQNKEISSRETIGTMKMEILSKISRKIPDFHDSYPINKNKPDRLNLPEERVMNFNPSLTKISGSGFYSGIRTQPWIRSFTMPVMLTYYDESNPQLENNKGKFALELDNFATWALPKARLPDVITSAFNNRGLSFLYNLNERYLVGLDIRQESFYTEYKGTEPDSMLYQYYQQSNFTTFGVKARLYPWQENAIKPYVQLGAGLNKGGAVLRPFLGVKYEPYPDLSFTGGLEYSWFLYKHQESWYISSKIGLSYGLSIKF